MAQYTIQLRTILQQYWLDNNPDKTLVDVYGISPYDLCNGLWNSVFDFDFPMFNGMTKQELCTQILMFYFMREIGLETIPLWKHYLWIRMNGIMPYYVKLAESEISKADALQNKKVTEKITREGGEQEKSGIEVERKQEGTTDTNSSVNQTQGDDSTSYFSDTPQNGIQDVKNGTYLTNATVGNSTTTNNGTSEGKTETSSSENMSQNGARNRDYDENVSHETLGFDGDVVETIQKYRESLLQIPLMIIKDLADLFISILD